MKVGALAIPALLERATGALHRLPRETRDTLVLLAVIAFTIAPHLTHLPLWCSVLVAAVLGWRARLALTGGALPGRWAMWALLILTAALTLWTERTLLGREAGVNLLVALLALKTLELRARRDALVVFFLGFFLVLTQFLYSQELLTGVWMLLALWALLSALVLAHMPVGRPSLGTAAAVAARATLLGLPVMALLFVLFPRIGPLWGLPQDAAGKTGLSGTMRLGSVAEVANDDSIAFRVRFSGPRPLERQLYFRGPVLATTDGREWTRLAPSVPPLQRTRAELRTLGEPLRYQMTLEPGRLTVLPLLEATPERAGVAPRLEGWAFSLRPDLQWQSDRPLAERIRIEASAWLDFRHGPREPVPGLRDFMQLPPQAHPRTRQWAAQLRARPDLQRADAAALTQAVLEHIRTAGFTYTLEPGSYGGDAIDEFWFDRKLGFCEHYAAAYVVVMRALDVPARIVTGYQGMDAEPQDGDWVVRQRNAHAWAEYWRAGEGWVRVDPTAAVAPDRVQIAGRSLAPPPGLVAGALRTLNPQLMARLRNTWETINNRWNQWVLNYSRTQQFDLLRSLGFGSPNWQDLTTLLIGVLCSVSLLGAAWAWWDRRRQDPWLRLTRRVQHRLALLGVPVRAHEPPRTRALRVRERLGAAGEALAAQLEALDRLRYAEGVPARAVQRAWWPAFAAAARQMPRAVPGSSTG